MEHSLSITIPPELWSHILSFTEDVAPFRLQRVCKFFYSELKKKAAQLWFVKLLQQKDMANRALFPHFSTADRHEYLPVVGRENGDLPNVYYYLSKVLVAGPSGVGKSTFWCSFKNEGQYLDPYPSNIGVEFCMQTLRTRDDISVKLQFWDTAGSERFRMLQAGYFRGVSVILFMFALDDRQSFQELVDIWFAQAFEKANLAERSVVCYLVGLKVDKDKDRTVTRFEGETVAKRYHMKYFEASGQVYSTVTEVMNSVLEDTVDALIENHIREFPPLKPEINSSRTCSIM